MRYWPWWKDVAFGAALVAFTVALAWAGGAFGGELGGRVVKVVDGDTIDVLVDGRAQRVRLLEIDAPEIHQPYGRASREHLAAMCAGVEALVQTSGRDRNGRWLGRVYCAGKDANAEQLRAGAAWVFTRYVKPGTPAYTLEAGAKAARRGLWAEPDPVAPWDWRLRKH